MDSLNSGSYKYNPSAIKKLFKTSGNAITVLEELTVMFPERYEAQELAFIGSTVKTVSIFAVVDSKKNYAVVLAPVYIELSPMNITSIDVDGTVNKVLEFQKGGIFSGNTNLIINEDFMYNLFDEFFLKGKIPWFLSYEHISNLFMEAKKYAGSKLGGNPLAMEILTAIISRVEGNKEVFFRQVLESSNSKKKKTHVGLNNIYYSFDNTNSKINGSYYGSGVSASVINPESKTTKVADVLRA
jgi:hypothetical protein